MVRLPRPRLRLPSFGGVSLPTAGGVAAALAAATFFAFLPDWRLETLVDATGLPRLLPLAQPPLGATARALLAAIAALLAVAVTWSALFLLWGPGGIFHRASSTVGAPSVRRADAHPDAPPRPPMTAAELGAPPPAAERDIPADLNQPLAAFDPRAIPAVPMEPARPLPSAAPKPIAVAPAPPPPVPEPTTVAAVPLPAASRAAPLPRNDEPSPSIAALLDRLERGARRRA